jgi:transcriptional regulator with XRE-family HTH domain
MDEYMMNAAVYAAPGLGQRVSEFSDWLSRVMDARGLKLRDVGERVGRSPNTVGSWKKGAGVPPSWADCGKIAEVFEEDPAYVRELAGYVAERPAASAFVTRIESIARVLEGSPEGASLDLVAQSLLEKHQRKAR